MTRDSRGSVHGQMEVDGVKRGPNRQRKGEIGPRVCSGTGAVVATARAAALEARTVLVSGVSSTTSSPAGRTRTQGPGPGRWGRSAGPG